jgi:hypothetical protein
MNTVVNVLIGFSWVVMALYGYTVYVTFIGV